MLVSRDKLVIGLTSLCWSLIGPLYLGNILVFYSFNSIFIVCIFFIVLSVLNREILPSRIIMIPVGFILGLAILNDPLMYLPVLIVFLFLAFSCLTSGVLRKDQFRNANLPSAWCGFSIACLRWVFDPYRFIG